MKLLFDTNVLITGDKELLELGIIKNCKIIKPADLWKI